MPRIPRAKFPFGITHDYFTGVRAMLLQAHANVWQAWENRLSSIVRKDSLDQEIMDVTILLDNLREYTFQFSFTPEAVEETVLRFVTGVQTYNQSQFARQTKAVLGVMPLSRNERLNAIATAAVKENVSYIQSIPAQYHDRLETVILQGLRRGKSTSDMAEEIQKVYEVNRERARFIARDQAGSLMTDMTKARHQDQGLEGFIWRTAGDGVVRDSHADLEGKRFRWDEGARGLLPGEDYGCRCVAEVDVEELLAFKEVNF